jgi:aryl-alcohol dehydrogenase-like predicted oxidoreductase
MGLILLILQNFIQFQLQQKHKDVTSKYIGNWLNKSKTRDQVIIASKIAGPGDYTAHIRTTGFSPNSIEEALDLELKRLQTDYIDLYQLHWPERQTNTFGVRDFKPSQNDPWTDNFNEVLHSLNHLLRLVKLEPLEFLMKKVMGHHAIC